MRRVIPVIGLMAFFCAISGCGHGSVRASAVKNDYPGVPEIVTPGLDDNAPGDAIVLFDGSDLSQWRDGNGNPAAWRVEKGAMVVRPGEGDIYTVQTFGDCQLHLEWVVPENIESESSGQSRGNSGVFLMGKYEVQILDSYENSAHPAGQAGAVYSQSPPLVNACRAPGKWQTYDIVFRRPHFKGKELTKAATVTVLHNGVLVQDQFEIEGTTYLEQKGIYEAHPPQLPLRLQDHGTPVRFRNIWIRHL